MKWRVPFFDLNLGEEEKRAVLSVIDSNWLTSGPKIKEFERAFSEEIGKESYAVSVSSATAALHLSMLSLGIEPGDEVILPSLTFVACANVVRYVGAKPVFADINSKSDWNISLKDVEEKITSRTRAIMVVHYAGYPCNMEDFVNLADKYDLILIEDCSHSPLGHWAGKSLGTYGHVGCFSFFSNKNITTGEGGMVVTKDKELVNKLFLLRSHGMTSTTYQRYKSGAGGYDVTLLGYNYRLDEIRAAIGIEQLKKLKEYNALRKNHVDYYRYLLSSKLPSVLIPFLDYDHPSSYHIFPILLPGSEYTGNQILCEMENNGIQCSIHYKPIHKFSAYSDLSADLPVTENIYESILTLPLYPGMNKSDIELVINVLTKCLSKIR